jgi:hypothetical protein
MLDFYSLSSTPKKSLDSTVVDAISIIELWQRGRMLYI